LIADANYYAAARQSRKTQLGSNAMATLPKRAAERIRIGLKTLDADHRRTRDQGFLHLPIVIEVVAVIVHAGQIG
jgi:hypothetical protein